MSDPVAKLLVTLGMDSTAFTRGAKRAADDIGTMRRRIDSAVGGVQTAMGVLAGSLVVDQIVRAASAGLDYASSLGETAEQLGVSTKALQEYRYAASQVGIEQAAMDKALAQGTRRLGDAAIKGGKAAAVYQNLGIDIRDATGKVRDIGDLLPEIAEGLKSIESPAERASILVAMFGKSGQQLAPLLSSGAAGVNDLRKAAQELGIVMDDAMIAKADAAADKMSELKQVLEARIAIAVTDNADSILELVDALGELVKWLGKAGYAWRAFRDLRWDGTQSPEFLAREFGPPVELTFDPAELPKGRANPAIAGPTVRPGASGNRTGKPDARFLQKAPSLLQRRNAVGVMGGGDKYSGFAAGGGATGWMAASGVDPEREIANAEAAAAALDKAAIAALKAKGAFDPGLTAATGKLSKGMAELRDRAQGLLDRLFPEQAEVRQFDGEMALLGEAHRRGVISADAHRMAVERLRRELLGLGAAPMWDAEIVDVASSTDTALEDAANRAADVSDVLEAEFEKIAKAAEVQKVQVVESFAEMTNGTLREVDRLVKGLRSGNALDIVGGLLGALDGIGRLVGGFSLGPLKFGQPSGGAPVKVPAAANGGTFRIGGMGGVDRNLLSMNGRPALAVSRGETMTITPANDRGPSGAAMHFDLRGAVMTEDLLRQMQAIGQQAAQQGAAGGAELVRERMGRVARRRLA